MSKQWTRDLWLLTQVAHRRRIRIPQGEAIANLDNIKFHIIPAATRSASAPTAPQLLRTQDVAKRMSVNTYP